MTDFQPHRVSFNIPRVFANSHQAHSLSIGLSQFGHLVNGFSDVLLVSLQPLSRLPHLVPAEQAFASLSYRLPGARNSSLNFAPSSENRQADAISSLPPTLNGCGYPGASTFFTQATTPAGTVAAWNFFRRIVEVVVIGTSGMTFVFRLSHTRSHYKCKLHKPLSAHLLTIPVSMIY